MSVMGDLMGELDGEMDGDLDGDDVVGVIKRNPRTGRAQIVKAGPNISLPAKPAWRKRALAPGVSMPGDQRLIVPCQPQVANGLFNATTPAINYVGEPQKPFRGDRILVSVVRTGASATGRLMAQLFAGVDLQQGSLGQFDIELLGQAGAFQVAIAMTPVDPGVKITFQIVLDTGLTAPDTIRMSSITLLGDRIG